MSLLRKLKKYQDITQKEQEEMTLEGVYKVIKKEARTS